MKKKAKKRTDFAMAEADFITLTSHQLRTPLSGTKWLIELLQKNNTGKLNRKQKDYLEKIYHSNERMIALVNDLLEVSRLESGETKLYLQPTDLEAVFKVLIREKAIEIRKKKIKVTFTVEPEPFPNIRTEPIRIKQVLDNILQNSITYSHSGAKIHISLRLDKNKALIEVSDTGIGIPKKQQSKVFSKFFRGSNILAFETTGTGLGMYIAKSFIKASKGKIWFKSKEGKGTSFYFTLPLA